MNTKYVLFFFLFFSILALQAQELSWDPQEGVEADPGKAKEQYTLVTDGAKTKDWETVSTAVQWLVAYNPKLHKSIYQNGEKAFKALEKKEKDAAKKAEYQDIVLDLFKKRIENFGEEKKVMKRVGNVAFNYLKDRPNGIDSLAQIYGKIYEFYGKNTPRTHALIMMIVACNQKKKGQLDDKQVLAKYDQIAEIMETGLAEAKDEKKKAKWIGTQEKVDGVLGNCVEINCDFVKENFGPKLKDNPSDIKLAKKVMKYMLAGKCTDDPLFLLAIKSVFVVEQDGSLAKVIAGQHMAKSETDSALVYYNQAAALIEADSAKADIFLNVGKILGSKGQLSKAREYAFKAAKASSSKASEAYSFVAGLYMNSGKSCGGSHPVNGRVAYLAAYDMYAKAGNSSGMVRAKSQFPSKTDIFTFGMSEGQSLSVGCWIGGSTTLRVR